MDYAKWKTNLVRLLKESNIKKIHMMMTINSLCLESITEFMDDMLELRKEFRGRSPSMTLNILRFPSFQSAAILPENLKTEFKQNIEEWFIQSHIQNLLYDSEKAHIQRLIDYLDVVKTPHRYTSESDVLYKDFRSFFEQYDRRRNKDFRKTFPKFVEWYDSIPYTTNQKINLVNFNPVEKEQYVDK